MTTYKWPLLLSLTAIIGLLITLTLDGIADELGVALTATPLVAVLVLVRRAKAEGVR